MIFSTATAFNFVPRSLSTDFFYNLLTRFNIQYKVAEGMFAVQCNQPMPNVYFFLGSYWVEIKGKDMLIDI
jgi:hypothetical protein